MTKLNLNVAAFLITYVLVGILQAAAAPVTLELCQQGVNCIANYSFRDQNNELGIPAHWVARTFGMSDAKFAIVPGHDDGHAANIEVTSAFGAEDAKWAPDMMPVLGGQYLVYSGWYKSNVPTEIVAYFEGGGIPEIQLATVPASEDWTNFTLPGFFVPAGAAAVVVTQNLSGVGNLAIDETSLVLTPPPVFSNGLVSLTFDDGLKSVYTHAVPILNRAGLKSTQYIYTDAAIGNHMAYDNNVSLADVLAMRADGHEIGSLTRKHHSLTKTVTDSAGRSSEINGSQADFLGAGIADVVTFAYPYGNFDANVEKIVAASYLGARSVQRGFNTTLTDHFALKTQMVQNATSAGEIEDWIDYAMANNLWLILTFHRVENTLADCTDKSGQSELDCTDISTLQKVADHLKGVPNGTVRTVADVLQHEDLWMPKQPLIDEGGVTTAGVFDPTSSYAGTQITLEYAMNVAYAAGFQNEDSLLKVLGVAIGESDLWTSARNWQPQWGWRPLSDVIGLNGPKSAWSANRQQMHSDRGLFQLSSHWWPDITDSDADNPRIAAAKAFGLSKNGTDFSLWDSYQSRRAMAQFDQSFEGWPELRPIVRNFLKRVKANRVGTE